MFLDAKLKYQKLQTVILVSYPTEKEKLSKFISLEPFISTLIPKEIILDQTSAVVMSPASASPLNKIFQGCKH